MSRKCFSAVAAWLIMLLCLPLHAQDQSLDPVSGTYAITNVNIIQAPGRKIDMGIILVKDGLITAVGKNVSIPPNAIVIKADSMYAYAGFIDGLSRAGVVKPKEDQNGERPKDPGNPDPAQAGITPYLDVRASLQTDDKAIEELRNLGFTVAQVVPYGGMLPGNGAVILLGGKSANDMVVASQTAFYSEFAPARRMYPATVMGVMAKYRELYRQAVQNKNYASLYAANRSGLQRPESDRVLEAFYPVIDKKQPVLFKTERVVDAQRAMTLQKDLGFALSLANLKEGWDITGKIKSANAKVFLSLELPEEMKAEKKDDKEKKDAKAKTAEEEALEKRKAEFIAKYTGQAALFTKQGIRYGFSTLTAKPKDIPANIRRMIAAGLTEDQALAALTTTPAELLGLADRMGTIDNGKMANIVITDKSYFDEKAKVRFVFVDGKMYKLDVKEVKKGDNGAKADAAGEWSYTTETPQGTNTGKIKIKRNGSGYEGTISNSMMSGETALNDVSVDGKTLTFSFNFSTGGGSMTIEVTADIEGNEFDGSMAVGSYGSFPIRGKKEPN